MSDGIMWCHTHHSQVVWVRDQIGLRSWCAIGDDIDDEEECSIGGARVVRRSDDMSERREPQRYGARGAYTVTGVGRGRTARPEREQT